MVKCSNVFFVSSLAFKKDTWMFRMFGIKEYENGNQNIMSSMKHS